MTQIMVFSNNSEYDDTEAVPLEGAFYSTISYEKLFLVISERKTKSSDFRAREG
ncbi:MAG: hypothetical protein ACLSE4_16740 [Clostridium sp.]